MPIFETRNIQQCGGCERMVAPDASGSILCCSRCKLAYYCNRQCQRRDWSAHKPLCRPRPSLPTSPPSGPVPGVRMLPGNRPPFQPRALTVPPTHPIWKKGTISPVSQLIDMPLLIYKEVELPPGAPRNIDERSNQAVTYMMIDPGSGFAPLKWQDDNGPAIVVRADQSPLTVQELAVFWSYCCDLLDYEWAIPEERGDIIAFLNARAYNEYRENQQR